MDSLGSLNAFVHDACRILPDACYRKAPQDIREAAVLGSRMRFRAVMMTSFAFILDVYPLVTGGGRDQPPRCRHPGLRRDDRRQRRRDFRDPDALRHPSRPSASAAASASGV